MRINRNLRLLLVEEYGGELRASGTFGEILPTTHVREGESLRHAAFRLARESQIEIRSGALATIAEREWRRPNDRMIDLYFRAVVIGGNISNGNWIASSALSTIGLEPRVLRALGLPNGAPYLGNLSTN